MAKVDKLTIKQVAQELGVDERTVRRWIANGELPYVGFDIRGRYLIARTDLDEFVRKRTEKREPEPQ
jgi:excisionase family DNA binding protein